MAAARVLTLASAFLLALPSAPAAAQPAADAARSASGGRAAAAADAPAAARRAAPAQRAAERRPTRPSEGAIAGLHRTEDPIGLKSSTVLVVDQDSGEILLEKNAHAILPIASITKLMTAIVTVEAGLPLDEELVVTRDDVTVDRIRSRLLPGTRLTRAHALQLALMSSENHAAQLLGRTYPGGLARFVDAMNAKARLLAMERTRFVDPTGLSADNRSSPADLVRLVDAAYEYDLIREFSTARGLELSLGRGVVRYGNTNGLTASADWDIGVQKTGFIAAAGRCLVMQAVIEGRRVVMVLLDSVGRYSRIGDAQRVRAWLATQAAVLPAAHSVAPSSPPRM